MKRLLQITYFAALLITINASALNYEWGYVFDSGWEIRGILVGDSTGANGSLQNVRDVAWHIYAPEELGGTGGGPFYNNAPEVPVTSAVDLIPDAGLPTQFFLSSVDIGYMIFSIAPSGAKYQVEMNAFRGYPGDIAGDVLANDSWYLTAKVPDSGSTLLLAFVAFTSLALVRRTGMAANFS